MENPSEAIPRLDQVVRYKIREVPAFELLRETESQRGGGVEVVATFETREAAEKFLAAIALMNGGGLHEAGADDVRLHSPSLGLRPTDVPA